MLVRAPEDEITSPLPPAAFEGSPQSLVNGRKAKSNLDMRLQDVQRYSGASSPQVEATIKVAHARVQLGFQTTPSVRRATSTSRGQRKPTHLRCPSQVGSGSSAYRNGYAPKSS